MGAQRSTKSGKRIVQALVGGLGATLLIGLIAQSARVEGLKNSLEGYGAPVRTETLSASRLTQEENAAIELSAIASRVRSAVLEVGANGMDEAVADWTRSEEGRQLIETAVAKPHADFEKDYAEGYTMRQLEHAPITLVANALIQQGEARIAAGAVQAGLDLLAEADVLVAHLAADRTFRSLGIRCRVREDVLDLVRDLDESHRTAFAEELRPLRPLRHALDGEFALSVSSGIGSKGVPQAAVGVAPKSQVQLLRAWETLYARIDHADGDRLDEARLALEALDTLRQEGTDTLLPNVRVASEALLRAENGTRELKAA